MVATTTTPERQMPAAFGWMIVARLLVVMTFLQPLFIGMMFSGYGNGLNAHRANAYALVLLTIVSLFVAARTQRSSPAGRKLVTALGRFLVGLIVVAIIGILSSEGYRLHWLHFPAGVGMVGGAMGVMSAVGSLRQPTED
jgi:hypothetical protein